MKDVEVLREDQPESPSIYMKNVTLIAVLLLSLAGSLLAQTPTFRGHPIGESVAAFFEKATLNAPSHESTGTFCNRQLHAPGVTQFYETAKSEIAKAEPHKHESSEDMAKRIRADIEFTSEFEECLQVDSAMHNRDGSIMMNFSSDLGPGGKATFHNGKLVYLEFDSNQGFAETSADMRKKLERDADVIDYKVMQNELGATFQYPRASWNRGPIESVIESSSTSGEPPIIVKVWDSQWANEDAAKREATRPNSLN